VRVPASSEDSRPRSNATCRPLRRPHLAWFALIFLGPHCATGQDAQQPPDATQPPPPQTTLATVHGVVRNIASGAPLPRALVHISGDANTGTLTDGEGRFEIHGVPVGPQGLEVIKPGFIDELAEFAGASSYIESREFAHNVIVEADMPDVVFAMTPTNAIRGQIVLSTGEPGEGIGVSLLKETIERGRAFWQTANHDTTNAEGVFRFGSLPDGTYAVFTDPAMDTESGAGLVEKGSAANVARGGYASQFYTRARDLAGAARIQLQGGTTAEADLSLTLEPFHAVTATVLFPGATQPREGAPGAPPVNYSTTITDSQGHELPYRALYDETTRTVQASLPDGSYTLLVTAAIGRTIRGDPAIYVGPPARPASFSGDPGSFAGLVDFSVAGHAIANLRIPIAEVRPSPVEVTLARTTAASPESGSQPASNVILTLTQTGGSTGDGITSMYAQGRIDSPLRMIYTPPGQYWLHTNVPDKQVCESSVMAGGVNLAREPLAVGPGGTTATVSLSLRDDCASLALSLPAVLSAQTSGEEPFLTVYVVPDFDSTADVIPQTLRASTGGRVTIHGLTPGDYHVYSFNKPMSLAYHNKDVLAALADHAQPVELSSGATSSLVLEVPKS
jgi:hypothetical protein